MSGGDLPPTNLRPVRATGVRPGRGLVGRLVVAAAAVALAGCGSEGQQASTDLPPVSTSAAESMPELSPLGPPDLPMPAEARVQDEAGAEAFVRYYIELINRASRTLDAEPLRGLSNDCADCQRIASDFENDAAAGYRYEGGEITVVSYEKVKQGEQVGATFVADRAALRIVDASGRPVDGLDFPAATDLVSGAEIVWDESRSTWTMAQLLLGSG
jgi:hypothetical protein